MSIQITRFFAISALCASFGCTSNGTDACTGVSWPSLSGSVSFVSASCGSSDGDGSRSSPFAAIGDALVAAPSGTTVAVAAGTYAESLKVPAGVSVVGIGSTLVHIAPSSDVGIAIESAGASRIEGLTISGAKGSGIRISKAAAILVNIVVENTVAGAVGTSGNGITADGAASIDVQGSKIANNAGIGIAVTGSGKVAIIDPVFSADPLKMPRGKDSVGIIDPVFTPQSAIANNAMGGIAIIDPVFLPKADGNNTDALSIKSTDIRDNTKWGVHLVGAGATIERSAVRGTKKPAAGEGGDGIWLEIGARKDAPVPNFLVDAGTFISGNGRAGLLLETDVIAEIASELSLNGRCGLWAEGAKTVVHIGPAALFGQNTMIGAAITEGAMVKVEGATFSNAVALKYTPANGASVDLADGIGIYDKARGSITGAKFIGNKRVAVLARDPEFKADGTPSVLVTNCTISGSKYGVVIHSTTNSKQAGVASAAPSNSYADVTTETDDTDLPAQTSLCDYTQGEKCDPPKP